MGARGNSGVIFSQIVRGAAEVLGGAEPADVPTCTRALRGGERRRLPRRAPAGRGDDAHRDPRDGGGGRGERRGLAAPSSCTRSSAAARTRSRARRSCSTSCARPASSTRAAPACSRSCAGSPRGSRASRCRRRSRARSSASRRVHQELSRYRYCTVFVVEGDGLDADALESELEQLGDSLLVVGDAQRAQGARPHRRARAPRSRSAPRRGTIARGRDREHARPDRRARGAAQRARRPRRRRRSTRRRRRRRGGGKPAPVRLASARRGSSRAARP